MLAPCEVLNNVVVVVIIIIIIVICKAAYALILVSRSIDYRAQQAKISTV